MVTIRRKLGDRFAYLGGLPTAEVYAAAYKALGVPVYSSAVFNFIPKTAMQFYRAVAAGDSVHDAWPARPFFPAVSGDPQSSAGLCGEHRESRSQTRGPRCRDRCGRRSSTLPPKKPRRLDQLIKALGPQ